MDQTEDLKNLKNNIAFIAEQFFFHESYHLQSILDSMQKYPGLSDSPSRILRSHIGIIARKITQVEKTGNLSPKDCLHIKRDIAPNYCWHIKNGGDFSETAIDRLLSKYLGSEDVPALSENHFKDVDLLTENIVILSEDIYTSPIIKRMKIRDLFPGGLGEIRNNIVEFGEKLTEWENRCGGSEAYDDRDLDWYLVSESIAQKYLVKSTLDGKPADIDQILEEVLPNPLKEEPSITKKKTPTLSM